MGKRYGRNQKRRHREHLKILKMDASWAEKQREVLEKKVYTQKREIAQLKKYDGFTIRGWSEQGNVEIRVDIDATKVACNRILEWHEMSILKFDPVEMIIQGFTNDFTEYLRVEVPRILDKLTPLNRCKIKVYRR